MRELERRGNHTEFKPVNWSRVCKILGVTEERNLVTSSIRDDVGVVGDVRDNPFILVDCAAIVVCTSGSVATTIAGVNQTLAKGQMCIVFADTYSRFYSMSDDFMAELVFVNIRNDGRFVSLADLFPHLRHNTIVKLEAFEERVLLSLMEYIAASNHNGESPARLELDGNAMSLLRAEISDICLRHNLSKRELNADEQLAKRFLSLLSVGAFEHRDVEWFAHELGVSPKRFASSVRRATGKNPSEIICATVIAKAKVLLQSTKLTSSEISERLNFPTPSFFCRYFKRYAGVTPSEWRGSVAQQEEHPEQ